MASTMAKKVATENRRPEHVRHAVLAGSLLGTHGNLAMSCIQQLIPSMLLMAAL